jgi:TM2 domain-containing membrane protein YozV
MKKATKASMLSACIFPGTGHIYLKKYIPGIILALVSFSGFYYLTSSLIRTAFKILEKIQNGDIQPDFETINQLLTDQLRGNESQTLNIYLFLIIICWIIGVIDSYRLGRQQDKYQ